MQLTLTYHQDPGHGWLEVPLKHIDALQLRDRISCYSYQKGASAYLEEDCDAAVFMSAARAAGWTIQLREIHTEFDNPIRDFPPFTN